MPNIDYSIMASVMVVPSVMDKADITAVRTVEKYEGSFHNYTVIGTTGTQMSFVQKCMVDRTDHQHVTICIGSLLAYVGVTIILSNDASTIDEVALLDLERQCSISSSTRSVAFRATPHSVIQIQDSHLDDVIFFYLKYDVLPVVSDSVSTFVLSNMPISAPNLACEVITTGNTVRAVASASTPSDICFNVPLSHDSMNTIIFPHAHATVLNIGSFCCSAIRTVKLMIQAAGSRSLPVNATVLERGVVSALLAPEFATFGVGTGNSRGSNMSIGQIVRNLDKLEGIIARSSNMTTRIRGDLAQGASADIVEQDNKFEFARLTSDMHEVMASVLGVATADDINYGQPARV